MNHKKIIAFGIAFVLVGVLIGFLLWGQRSERLTNELADVRARLQRSEERPKQIEGKLKEAESMLQKVTEELEFEKMRRRKLELLISQGRK